MEVPCKGATCAGGLFAAHPACCAVMPFVLSRRQPQLDVVRR